MAAGTRFCAGCGAPAADPETTRYAGAQPQQPYQAQPYPPQPYAPVTQPPPAAYSPAPRYERANDVEREIFKTRPTLLFIKIGYGLAALGAILVIILLAYFVSAPWWLALPIALALLLIPAYYHVKRNLVLYTLTNHKLEVAEGFLTRTTINYPLRQIQDVTIRMSFLQRLLGYGDVIIENSGEDINSDETMLHNVRNPKQYADMLLREMRRFL
jgi:membrane protein YdbS with pleckstrin-like domain